MKICIRLITIAAVLSMPSCSTFLAGSGKPYVHLAREGVKVDEVRRELGQPAYTRSYSSPRPIKNTQEYQQFVLKKGYNPGISGAMSDDLVTLCDVYQTKGRYADSGAAQSAGMVFALTLGLGELIFFPKELGGYIADSNKTSSVTFWYDDKGVYVADYRGNIADLQTNHDVPTESKRSRSSRLGKR